MDMIKIGWKVTDKFESQVWKSVKAFDGEFCKNFWTLSLNGWELQGVILYDCIKLEDGATNIR